MWQLRKKNRPHVCTHLYFLEPPLKLHWSYMSVSLPDPCSLGSCNFMGNCEIRSVSTLPFSFSWLSWLFWVSGVFLWTVGPTCWFLSPNLENWLLRGSWTSRPTRGMLLFSLCLLNHKPRMPLCSWFYNPAGFVQELGSEHWQKWKAVCSLSGRCACVPHSESTGLNLLEEAAAPCNQLILDQRIIRGDE